MSSQRTSSWNRNPDASGSGPHQVDPGKRARSEAPEGIDAIHAAIDKLRPLIRRMKRHWRAGMAAFVLLGAVTAVVALRYKPSYLSETVVFHQEGVNPESLGGAREQTVDADFMRELLVRRGRMELLIDELKLHQKTVERLGVAVAVDELQKTIKFKAISNSTFKISYSGDSPEEAQKVTAWLADQLVQDDLERRRAQALKTKEFLDAELKRAESELAATEEALGQFIAKNPEFASAKNLQQPPRVGKAAPPSEPKAAATPAPGGRRRAPKAAPPTTAPQPVARHVEPDPALVAQRADALQELGRASRELADLASKYTDQHPEVQAARGRVRQAEATVKTATEALARQSADDIYDTIEDRPAPQPTAAVEPLPPEPPPVGPAPKAVAAADTAKAKTAPPPTENESLGAAETEHMFLKRSVDESRMRAERLAAESFRAEVASRSQGTGHDARVVVLDAAYLPAEPIRSRLFFAKIGLPIALLLALLLVIGRAIADDRIYDAGDLNHLGLDPLLTVIPRSIRPHV